VSGYEARKLLALVHGELLRLARHEDALAAAEAQSVRYWEPYPATVLGHRRAAAALRADAEVVGAAAGFDALRIGPGGSPGAISVIDWRAAQATAASPARSQEPGLAEDRSDP
jgi:hypothetical protein